MKKTFKNVVIATLLLVVITGCGSVPYWQGNLDCNLSQKEMSAKIFEVLTEEKFIVSPVSSEYMITAKSEEWWKPFVGIQHIVWMLRISDNKIIGTATLYTNYNGRVRDETLNDDARDGLTEYWRVRRKLEKICNNVMVLTNIRTNKESNPDDDEFKK